MILSVNPVNKVEITNLGEVKKLLFLPHQHCGHVQVCVALLVAPTGSLNYGTERGCYEPTNMCVYFNNYKVSWASEMQNDLKSRWACGLIVKAISLFWWSRNLGLSDFNEHLLSTSTELGCHDCRGEFDVVDRTMYACCRHVSSC